MTTKQLALRLPVKWPRLSETLRGPVAPDYCQSCGRHDTEADLTPWIECEQTPKDTYNPDRPILVMLCGVCADSHIERHARLYLSVDRNAPLPGAMELCIACRFRDRLTCNHPDSPRKGGSGLLILCSERSTVFFDGARGAMGMKRCGWADAIYFHAPSGCSGRDHQPADERWPLLTRDGQAYMPETLNPDEPEITGGLF